MTAKKFFYVLIGLVAALLLAGGYGYYYAITRITASKATLAQTLGTKQQADDELSDLAKLKIQYQRDIVPIQARIDDALPRTKNQTEILAQLQTIAASTGLVLSNVTLPSAVGLPGNTSQTVPAGKVLALPITFQLQGSYPQLQAFLSRVENVNRFTNVTSLAVSHSDKSNDVTYSMTVNVYIKP